MSEHEVPMVSFEEFAAGFKQHSRRDLLEIAYNQKDALHHAWSRISALEATVLAADRMREDSTMLCYGLVPKVTVMQSINDYDTQRAAVGEIS